MSLIAMPRRAEPSWKAGFARSASQSANPGLWKGLIGLWAPSLGPTGLTLRDVSGRGPHGVLIDMDPSTDWVVGEKGYALEFEPGGEHVDFNSGVLPDTTEWTMGIWCRWTAAAKAYALVDLGDTNNLLFFRQTDHSFEVYVAGTKVSDVILSTGEWHLILATLQGATATVYYDGQFTATLGGRTWTGMVGDMRMGNSTIGNRQWVGLIGTTFAYDRAITPNEVQQHYQDHAAPLRLRRRVFAAAVADAAPAGGGVNWIIGGGIII